MAWYATIRAYYYDWRFVYDAVLECQLRQCSDKSLSVPPQCKLHFIKCHSEFMSCTVQ